MSQWQPSAHHSEGPTHRMTSRSAKLELQSPIKFFGTILITLNFIFVNKSDACALRYLFEANQYDFQLFFLEHSGQVKNILSDAPMMLLQPRHQTLPLSIFGDFSITLTY